MTTWWRHLGDTGDTLLPFLDGVDDLTAATAVSATLVGCGVVQELTGAVVDAATRQVRVDLGPWISTAVLGDYQVLTHVDFGPTLRRTWPASPNTDRLVIIA